MNFLKTLARSKAQMMIRAILLFISALNAQSNSQTAQSTQNNAVAQKGEQSGQNTHAIIKGNLTLNGITKEIQLNTHLESNAKFQNIITLSGQINVKDFDIANFPVVSDFVDIGARIVLD